jgi:hypothetical protein
MMQLPPPPRVAPIFTFGGANEGGVTGIGANEGGFPVGEGDDLLSLSMVSRQQTVITKK